jgi:hypothetical protein
MEISLHSEGWTTRITVTGAFGVLGEVEGQERFLLPLSGTFPVRRGGGWLWLLPADPLDPGPAFQIRCPGSGIEVTGSRGGWVVTVQSRNPEVRKHPNRPRCDVEGRPWEFDFEGGAELAATLAAFYWDTLVPTTIERTAARKYRGGGRGYVLSSLQKGSYGGTYPAVDHEFQIKGRLALGGGVEQDVVRRMLELQLDLMRTHPEGTWRNPCALQPNGRVEYHVTRRSADWSVKAIMFFVTGNLEILESLWLYAARTKDRTWLGGRIDEIERVAGHVERQIDAQGRLWSDVYYEDQVMKDGRETMAQAFAIRNFGLLADLEDWLGRTERAGHWRAVAATLAANLTAPLPEGFWDTDQRRFVDWVDRRGKVHDHLHLLASELPVLLGLASPDQSRAVEDLLAAHEAVFQKFPSFVAARIEDYTRDEIGTGGPYDLCAAGRYWCWDAAYWSGRRDGARLRVQLEAVSAQARLDGYHMGERYDMNYVYYPSDKNWHGAAWYYEYPNVYAWVLVTEYLGFHPCLDADVLLRPLVGGSTTVRIETAGLQWSYSYDQDSFRATNLADHPRTLRLDLGPGWPNVPAGPTRLGAGSSLVVSCR